MSINISLLSTSNSSMTYNLSVTSDNSVVFLNLINRNQKFLGKWVLIPYKIYHDEKKYQIYSEPFFTMVASEKVLSRDWDTPEEDEVWANL